MQETYLRALISIKKGEKETQKQDNRYLIENEHILLFRHSYTGRKKHTHAPPPCHVRPLQADDDKLGRSLSK